MKHPELIPMIDALIAAPSVSSINPHWDQSNEGVIQHLADWFADAGLTDFRLEIDEQPSRSGVSLPHTFIAEATRPPVRN